MAVPESRAAASVYPHIVVLAFAQQGHINPLMQLSRKLASGGFIISFVLSENTVPTSKSSTISSNLSFVGVPDLLPPERSRGSSFRDSVDSMVNMEAGFSDLLDRFHRQGQHPVSYVIADAFMLWSQKVSASFGIPCIVFFTSNATSCSLFYRIPDLMKKGVLPFQRDEEGKLISKEKIRGVPGVPDIFPEEFPLCTTFDGSHFRYRFITDMAVVFQDSAAIIINTFEELEKDAMAALRSEKQVFSVGPLLLQLPDRPSRLDVNYWAEDDNCLTWLDKQAPSSVIFISIGSVASLSLLQFRDFALGLEASNQSFLWVVRPDSIDSPLEAALPENFLSRTKDRGLIIPWGPQLMILSHPSIGAFLTHGGWNSIIENLSTGGVPMICWPHVAEQRINRRLIVDLWRIGMEFNHLPDDGLAKEEVSRVIGEMMEGSLGRELRVNARKVKEMGIKAVGAGGSSNSNFNALAHYLKGRIKEQNGQHHGVEENGSNGQNVF